MTLRARSRLISGGRLHLQDGPIDLIIGANGTEPARAAAYCAAARRFATVLDELCGELDLLRSRPAGGTLLRGSIARRMADAVEPYGSAVFITPMAAVAGAVAEAILETMVQSGSLTRAYVNNGGDIALHLAPGQAFAIGLVSRPGCPSLFGQTTIKAADAVRGIATSGWQGRSFSLGIADAVTVLAQTAPGADAAATIIANAVDLPDHPNITRIRASAIQPDSDLGDLRVTRAVGPLSAEEKTLALSRGLIKARELIDQRLIVAAALNLDGLIRVACNQSLRDSLFPAMRRHSGAVLPALSPA